MSKRSSTTLLSSILAPRSTPPPPPSHHHHHATRAFFSTTRQTQIHDQKPKLTPSSISLFEAKSKQKLSFSEIAHHLGRSEVWTAALFYGQAKPELKDLEGLSKSLKLDLEVLKENFHPTSFFPTRGLGPLPPTDPLLYRLYEILVVFGYPIKSIIHEKFGDGIMSAIDFKCDVKKVHQHNADRVQITLNGKWLPYSRW